MKRLPFIFSIALTTLGLAGIILLQAYWIRESWRLKEEEFDTAVLNSLDNVSQKMQRREVIRVFSTTTEPDYRLDTIQENIYAIHKKEPIHRTHTIRTQTVVNDSVQITINEEQNSWTEDVSIDLENKSEELRKQVELMSLQEERIEQYGRELEEQLKTETESWFSIHGMKRIERLTHTVIDTLRESNIFKPAGMVEDLVSEVIIQMDRNELLFEEKIDGKELDTILTRELREKNINLPFKYQVYNTGRNKVLLHKGGDEPIDEPEKYRIVLAGTEGNFDELRLAFPSRKNHIIQSMAGIISISSLLSVFAIIGFIIMIRMFIRQQKIADMKTQFINNMTHEFKTPLATTLVAANTLNNPKVHTDSEQVKYYTDMIKEENRSMNRHIESILQAGLLEKNRLALKSEKTNLLDTVNATLDHLQLLITQTNTTINTELPESPCFLQGDPDHLQQMLTNLVTNAIKYSKEAPEVLVALKQTDNEYQLIVKDKGIGISRKEQRRIFDAFYRVDTGNIHNVKGFGLGLNYVQKIANYHKGKVMVNSTPGNGAEFTITLPAYE